MSASEGKVDTLWRPVAGESGKKAQRADVRFGSKVDMCSALGDVRFVPIADIRVN